jgi:FkbM family methyltransferase
LSAADDPPVEAVDKGPQSAVVVHALGSIVGSPVVAHALPAAFDGLEVHNNCKLLSEKPVTVSGTLPFGGYLASLGRTERAAADALEAVQVRLFVRAGVAGVGLLDAAGTTFLDLVDGLRPDRAHAVTFLIRGIQNVGPLMIRNADNRRVMVELLGADSFQLKDARELIQSHVFPDDLRPFAGWNRYYGRFAATPEEAIRQLLFDEMQEPLVMRWRSDLDIVITPGEEASRALFVSGMYEPASMLALYRFLFPGAVLYDVGANVGVFTLFGSRRVGPTGRVYSFEPSSRERAVLEKNVALNGCDNVTVLASAASDRSGTATLRVAAGQHRGQNTLAPSFAYPGVHMEREETVSLVALDDLWKTQAVRRPDVLKVDAEGSELHVLRGALSLLRDAMPVVVFEINDTLLKASGASRDAVEQLLTSFGYRLHRLDDASGALVPITTLAGVESENFVALPAEYVDRTPER